MKLSKTQIEILTELNQKGAEILTPYLSSYGNKFLRDSMRHVHEATFRMLKENKLIELKQPPKYPTAYYIISQEGKKALEELEG